MKRMLLLAALGVLLIQVAIVVLLVQCLTVSNRLALPVLAVGAPTAAPISTTAQLMPTGIPMAVLTHWHGWRATASVQACLDGQDAALLQAVYPDAVCLFKP